MSLGYLKAVLGVQSLKKRINCCSICIEVSNITDKLEVVHLIQIQNVHLCKIIRFMSWFKL